MIYIIMVIDILSEVSMVIPAFVDVEEFKRLCSEHTLSEVATYYGRNVSTIGNWRRQLGISKPSDRIDIDNEAIKSDYDNGLTINQIAEKYSCSHDTVTKRLKSMGIANSRAEGIKRHFLPTYDERWDGIKADLDAGFSWTFVRDKYHMRAENLNKLIQDNKYYSVDDDIVELEDRVKNIDIDNRSSEKKYCEAVLALLKRDGKKPNVNMVCHETGTAWPNVKAGLEKYGLMKYISRRGNSVLALEFEDMLKRHGVKYEVNNRYILDGKELDFYLPDKKLGIEINPVMTHSVDTKIGVHDKKYHQEKSLLAESKGIGLVHLYEYEQRNVGYLTKLEHFLFDEGVYVGARQCEIREVSAKCANEFFATWHFLGEVIGVKWIYGLYWYGELVSCVAVGKARYGDGDWELLRYCVRSDINVIGGFAKLLKKLRNELGRGRLVSYMDMNKRFSSENVYEKNGFTLDGVTVPDYVWVTYNGEKVMKRYLCQKSKIDDGSGRSETEIMRGRGYYRVFGAGNKKYFINFV